MQVLGQVLHAAGDATSRIVDVLSEQAAGVRRGVAVLVERPSIPLRDAGSLTLVIDYHRTSWDTVIFVNTSFEEALRRGIMRDAVQFGGPAAAERRYARRYHLASRMYINDVNPIQAADFVIDNDDPSNPRLRRTSV